MMALVPPPPETLAIPNLVILPAGTRLHRIHQGQFAGNAFNPCLGGPTRFAPVTTRSGACIPSLYAGSTLEAAIFETVFHDVPAASPFKTVPMRGIMGRRHSVLASTRDITVASLRSPDLARWGLERGDLVSAPALHYLATARWAEAVHRQFPAVEGLIWTSNRCDPADALVLFGDRVAPADLAIAATRNAAEDESLVADMRDAGRRAGITLTL